jgi:ABC-type transporter Mla maintaining outer membrane lipid asymmetry ATPase subunit MlaF/ABC-type transporter Mla maintaining outer membrane lipid asymmetry permease subunit MlaE
MTDPPSTEPALSIRNLSITLDDGRALLKGADLRVDRGAFVLLVGPSGSGKSTLLKLIAGLGDDGDDGPRVEGELRVCGSPAGGASRSKDGASPVGMVFQNLALFDELTAVDNVRFAIDHAGKRADGAPDAVSMLRRLGVPVPGRLSELSGGERQRVAVARTLAVDPEILLFDEPTTGLDPYRAADVADLIADTHRRTNRTVLVVTHDYAPFLRHEPRLILLDPRSARFRELPPNELAEYFDRGDPEQPPHAAAAPAVRGSETVVGDTAHRAVAPPRMPAWCRTGRSWVESPGEALLTLLGAATAPMGGFRRARWKLRYLWHYVRMVAVGTTAVYVAIAGAMLGFVTVFFGFSQLPYRQVTVPLLTEEFLAATGYGTYRVLVPLLIAVLMAGKCGAAVAADVGARRLTMQFEAMRSFGASPWHYLYGNAVTALAVAGPLLTLIGFAASAYACLVAFLMSEPDASVALFRRNFFATVWPSGSWLPLGTGWVILKGISCGVLTAALAYSIGSRPKASSVDISRDVGLTIFWASLGVLAIHAAFSFVEF